MTQKHEVNVNVEIERIMSVYGNSVARVCCVYLRDRGLAEDASQDTFVKVAANIDKLPVIDFERAWIMRIAVNTCKDILRSSWYRKERMNIPVHTMQLEDANHDLDAIIDRDSLFSCIVNLPIRYKDVILLHYYQGLTIREVAGVIRVSHSTVQRRIKKAESLIKEVISNG